MKYSFHTCLMIPIASNIVGDRILIEIVFQFTIYALVSRDYKDFDHNRGHFIMSPIMSGIF